MEPQFRILGPIEVAAAADAGRHIPRGRTLSFLALLLLHRGAVVPVDRGLDELWEARPTGGRRRSTSWPRGFAARSARASSLAGRRICAAAGGGQLDADQFEGLVRYGRAELARASHGRRRRR